MAGQSAGGSRMTWMCEHDTAAETDTFGSRESAMLGTERRRGRASRPGRRQERSSRHGSTPARKKGPDKPLPSSEPELRAVFDKLTEKFGTVTVTVDQPASLGALPLTSARDAG
ncbi:hypothetical protein FM21_23160 [Streptomyces mutabilis]|uniref:Uncharacterized protein n=1 Tax=Streptomyces mutabilis TaxID=67332 RepID=A0A086MXS7_9ACTN|nr:hypothetical protein FM21_23160 [Streptomyces mutabilis]